VSCLTGYAEGQLPSGISGTGPETGPPASNSVLRSGCALEVGGDVLGGVAGVLGAGGGGEVCVFGAGSRSCA
jgi:hypothetical protein